MGNSILKVLFLILLSGISAISAIAARDTNALREVINVNLAQGKTGMCAIRDDRGFLWVGTLNGISCFDGNGLPVYTINKTMTIPATASQQITSIFTYGNHILYGGTPGLWVFDRDSNKTIRFPFKTKYGVQVSAEVQKIKSIDKNHIWIITYGQGLFVFNTADSTLVQNSRHESFYSDIAVGSDKNIYVTSISGYLQTFNNRAECIGSVRLPDFISGKQKLHLAHINGNIWIVSSTALYQYNIADKSLKSKCHLANIGEASSIVALSDNNLLISSSNGLLEYNISSGTISDAPSWLLESGSKSINQLCINSDGSILVVAPTSVSCYMPNKTSSDIKILDNLPEQDSHNFVNDICQSSDSKNLWIGSENGLFLYNQSTKAITSPISLPGGNIAISSLNKQGDNLWIATRHRGLFTYNSKSGKIREYNYDENTPYAVLSNDINKVYSTSKGEVFVLTNWGLCKYNPHHDNFQTLSEINSNNVFLAMIEDRHGRLWTSTANNGLLMRTDAKSKFTPFVSKTLSPSPVSTMLLDSNGTLWISTQDNSIMYYDETAQDFARINVPLTEIYSIIFMRDDKKGNIWVGTQAGIVKIDQRHNLSYYSLKTANRNPFSMNPSCLNSDGEILFGLDHNLCMFNPSQMNSAQQSAKAFVQSISFPYHENNEDVIRQLKLDAPLYTLDKIKLPFANNTFTLHLVASRSSNMPAVIYEYQLEGVDKAWIRSSNPEVTYSNLQPGKYKFMLRPCFGSNIPPQSLIIEVLPPWYLSTTAYALYAILVLAAIGCLVFLSRRKVIEHYNRRNEEMKAQKEHEMYESKMRFFVNLVHEIRTPLTLINIPLERIAELNESGQSAPAEEKKDIESMQRNLGYLMNITNQLLDFRKAEHDTEVKLALTQINVNESLTETCKRFQRPMSLNQKHLSLSLPEEAVYASVDIEKISRVVMNLLGNAMKYSRTKVDVALTPLGDGKFSISVSDDGTGIPPEKREKVFEAYYQIDNDNLAVSLGTGLGLAYARLIARAHGGDIAIADNADGNTMFVLTLSCTNNASAITHPAILTSNRPEINLPITETHDFTILFVDDNQELRDTVSEALSRHNNVVTASDGKEALEILDKNDGIDMIISDFMMPHIDGAEFCRQVKSNVNTSHIPFIMLTAKAGIDAKEEGLESGADVYLEKPFSIKQLNLQIANFLHNRELHYAHLQSLNPQEESGNEPQENNYMNSVDEKFVNQINEIILENISDDEFSIDSLAELVNMSRSTFYRKIKAIFGMTPVDYLKNFRLNHAAKMLLNRSRATEAALASGFTSSSYFAKCFKAKFGVIPKDYVASVEKKDNTDSAN